MPTRNPFYDGDSSDDDDLRLGLQMSTLDMEAGGSAGFACQTESEEDDFKRAIELSLLAQPDVVKTTFKDDMNSVKVKEEQQMGSMDKGAGGSAGFASQIWGEEDDFKIVMELSLLAQTEVVKTTFEDDMNSVKVKEDDSMFTENSFAQPLVDRLTNSDRGVKLVLETNMSLRKAAEISKSSANTIKVNLAKYGWEWDDLQGVWKSNRQPGVTSQGAPRLGFGSGARPKQQTNSGWEDEKLGFWLDDVISGAKTLTELEVEEGISRRTMSSYMTSWGWMYNKSTRTWERNEKWGENWKQKKEARVAGEVITGKRKTKEMVEEYRKQKKEAKEDCLKIAGEVITGNRDIKEVSQENRSQVRAQIRVMGYMYSFRNGWVKK